MSRRVECGAPMDKAETRLFHALTDPLNKFLPTLSATSDALVRGVDTAITLFDWETAAQTISDQAGAIMVPEFERAWIAASGGVMNEVATDLTLLARVWSSQRTAELMTTWLDREAVRSVVMDAVGRGFSIPRTARLLRGSIGLDPRSANALARYAATVGDRLDPAVTRYAGQLVKRRAELIARTEIQGAVNAGRFSSWERAASRGAIGVGAVKTWVTAHDERVCPQCGPMDGESVPLSGMFSHGGRMPPRHPRCRCTAVIDNP